MCDQNKDIFMAMCTHTSISMANAPDESAIAVARIYVVSCIVNVRIGILEV